MCVCLDICRLLQVRQMHFSTETVYRLELCPDILSPCHLVTFCRIITGSHWMLLLKATRISWLLSSCWRRNQFTARGTMRIRCFICFLGMWAPYSNFISCACAYEFKLIPVSFFVYIRHFLSEQPVCYFWSYLHRRAPFGEVISVRLWPKIGGFNEGQFFLKCYT
jgi:hypothetical protein